MPIDNFSFRVVPQNTREWGRFFQGLEVSPEVSSVTTETLDDEAVTANKIADDSVTSSKIDDQAVTLTKVAPISADRILGKLTSTGSPEELTATQVRNLLFTQQANITAAEASHDLDAAYNETQMEAALDALGSKINEILTALDNLNLTA